MRRESGRESGRVFTLKILMLCYEFPPLGGGGARVVHGLSRELAGAGHEIDLVTMGFDGLPRSETVNGVRIHRVRSLRRRRYLCTALEAGSYLLPALQTARRLAARRRHDINHTHFIFPDGMLAWAIERSVRLPYVLTAHGSDVPGYNPHALKMAHKLLAPLWATIVRNAERVVCPSESLRSLVAAARGGDEKLTVIPNGIDLEKFRPDRPKRKRILVVTRMLERKGVQYFLEALQGVALDHEVHIVGDGPYLPFLRQAVRTAECSVRFWGWLDDRSPDFKELFETSSIYVFPSEAENFPVVLLEAMAAGMAIITTDETGCAEVVGDAALLVKPRDPAAIREALALLVRDPDRCRELGRAARRRLEEHFGWAAVAERYVALYRNVLSSTSAGAADH